jgi:hypothetical protein
MLDHADVHAVFAADRLADLAAAYEPGGRPPLRLRVGLSLVSLGERLARPYRCPRVTYARVR